MSGMVERVAARAPERTRAWQDDWWGVGALVLTALVLFAPVWVQGKVWIDGDLGDFYWPTLLTAFASLRQGQWPLWTPAMFGGFPLFADGSVGTLFPLNWVLLVSPAALMLIPFGRTLLAGLGMYLFLRTLKVGPLGATVGGLVFALNGFAVAHFSHIDLNNGTAMLPYTLWAIERSRAALGWRRQALWLLVAGLAHALAWVSLHPMAPLMILPVYVGWVVYRGFQDPHPDPLPRGDGVGVRVRFRSRWLLAALTLPLALALGLAAAQITPMLELGGLSPRQTAGARFNGSFSLPPYDLIGLVWPSFFHSPPGGPQWGLWNLETLVYLGTLPLVLALVPLVVWPRGRHVGFFAVTALLALWTAFAVYVPFGPQPLLYALPGFNVLRAPARFFYLAAFAGAYLAALGLDWLGEKEWSDRQRRRLGWLLQSLTLLAMLIPILAVAVLLFVNLVPRQAERAIWAFYLNLPHGTPLRYEDVVFALREKLNPLHLEMWKSVGLLLVSVGLVWAWLRGWLSARAFSLTAVLLTALDLVYLANHYVTPVPLGRVLEPRPMAEAMLQDRAARPTATLNGDRFFHTKPADPPLTDLPHGLPDFHGQSSLNMARPAAYIAASFQTETRLLDLASVRYLLVPNNLPDTRRWANGVAFDRDQPLTVVEADTPDYLKTFRVTAPARDLRLMVALGQAVAIPQGETVAELVVTGRDRVTKNFPLRAGIEAAEWAYDRPDVKAQVRHDKPAPAYTWNIRDETGQQFDRALFYVELPLTDFAPWDVDSVQVRVVQPGVQALVFGAALVGSTAPELVNLTRYDLTRYSPFYTDAEARVYVSQTTGPRAFLVGQAVRYDQRWQALDRLTAGLDTRQTMTLEGMAPAEAASLVVTGPPDPRQPLPPAPNPAGLGRVTLVEDESQRMTLQAETTAPAFLVLSDTYYPGWRATVDGLPAPILLANYTFRAVYLPPGAHTVIFAFEPTSVRLGMLISLATLLGMLGVGLVLFLYRGIS
ncbi:MAG: YfhO family protein [Anaerolineae bacterium]|nr:YfhO family protein [Anaerolineae bacterium]